MFRPAFGAILVLALGACTERSRPPAEAVLVLGTARSPDTLDPAFAMQSSEQEITRLLYRDLTTFDDAWRLVPDLAAALPEARTSSAGFEVPWRLSPGLKWSDGHPLTAADVRFGWTVEKDPALATVSQETAAQVAAFEVEAPTAFTVRWRQPTADYRAPRVHAILPAHAYPSPSPDRPFVGMSDGRVSSGPFRVKARVPGQHLALERNPHWAGPRPGLDRIVFRFFPSPDGFEAALATGEIDALGEAAGLTPDRVRALEARLSKTHEVIRTDGGVLLHLDVRHDHPALGRVDVRRALSACVDRSGLAAVTYDGLARPAYGLFPPRHPGFLPAPAPPDAAARAAAQARLRALPRPARRLSVGIGAGSPAASRAGAFLKDSWEKAGLEVELITLPMQVLFERMREGTHPPLVLYAWRVRPDWDGASALRTGRRQNYGGFSDPELDAALAEVARTLDPEARAARLAAVERRFRALLPAIPLLFRQPVSVRPKGLKGWRPTGTVTPVTWNAEAWRWAR